MIVQSHKYAGDFIILPERVLVQCSLLLSLALATGDVSSVSTSIYGLFHAWRVFLSRRVDAAWKVYGIFTCSPPPGSWTPRVTTPHDVADPARDRA